ncbi:uncharacterized protein PFD1115c [Condylostylus longicornis]|uniref:uncharacterized protein PFD1115c n=1 Tax=Condylostylus longicornis TaxID=2530218 RepID=UPI00244E0476|nr:uncharacterized protein PFD1115c [Condylostylus longicornis]XP_055374598.1 uncharacterized protein PFD1115c [Condylostylus longicornis]XP_055374599.1 uncharacterized protein PFD1115c [Condylostylus longicornis]XP_055374600.1 uncharacterized protein PFD1115c [Condylostylus longicornis]
MQRSHFWLLSCVCIALLINSINASTTHKPSEADHHENLIEYSKSPSIQKFDDLDDDDSLKETTHKILLKKIDSINSIKKDDKITKSDFGIVQKPTTIKKIIADSKKIPLADDPRFNKMLPEKNTIKDNSNKDSKKDAESDSEYDYDDDDDYDEYYDQLYVESSAENKNNKTVTTQKPKKEMKLKPIRGDDKDIPKEDKKTNKKKDDYEDDDEEDDDDNNDDEEVVYSNNVSCPRDCICDRNLNSEKVATCSRLDADIQKFGSDITDLVVVDVGPKYPIILGPSFFINIGLKNLNSLKISNCTLEQLNPSAFHGLTELFAVNLTNVGITHIDPDTFASNKRLRLLTISGNDLSSMTSFRTRTEYLIKSSSIEELDLSNNNFKEIQPNAFIHLPNIVYINLAQNELKTLPENLFNSVETIEDLDLSHNKITFLPPDIFKRTALARLDLKYNDIIGDLRFGTGDLQELDLSYCSIKLINNHMFNKMTGLLTLDLKGNGIVKVQPDSFTSLNYLRHIDLSYNNLEQLSSMLFYKNPNLDVIRLNDNSKLSELPPDGFQSFTRVFAVYLLDISNCAINALGESTFSQMPHLTTLKLSWNNINNMHRNAFGNLKQLTELDLSNNLIVKLDETLFRNNKQMSKLNLSGNPIRNISTKLFQTNTKLHELDVSDCELHNVLEDYYYDNQQNLTTAFFDTLRVFNISFNKIKKISKKNLRLFKNLKTFSFEGNLLKCNDEFKGLIKYLIQKGIYSGRVIEKSVLDIPFKLPAHTLQGWDEIIQTVCKRENEKLKLRNQKTIRFDTDNSNNEENEEDEEEEIENDENNKKDIFAIKKKVPTKEQGKKILDGLKEEENVNNGKNKDKNNAAEEKESDENENDDSDDNDESDTDEENDDDNDEEEEEDNSKEEDDDDGNDDEYNDEYDYEEDKKNKIKVTSSTKLPRIKNIGLFVDEVNVIRETDDKFLRGKLLTDDDLEDDGEEIIIQHGRIYYENYRYLKIAAVLLIIFSLLLLIIGKIITIIRRKRGERYRMAILASKNSIVYKKLSEEITKPVNKNPKVHRYLRINQV